MITLEGDMMPDISRNTKKKIKKRKTEQVVLNLFLEILW